MEHREHKIHDVSFSLIITSDSVVKGLKKDEITPLVSSIIKKSKFRLVESLIVGNNKEHIRKAIKALLPKSDVVIVTGGTGLSSKDLSVSVLNEMGFKEIRGFGELFRSLSFSEIGPFAWLSNASAFVVDEEKRKLVFALPGNPNAVKLALEKLILPVIAHALWELRR